MAKADPPVKSYLSGKAGRRISKFPWLEGLALSDPSILNFFLVLRSNPGQTGRRAKGGELMTISTVSAVMPSVQVFKHN
jgi:hypothetical protein